jgi:hypothetical protein
MPFDYNITVIIQNERFWTIIPYCSFSTASQDEHIFQALFLYWNPQESPTNFWDQNHIQRSCCKGVSKTMEGMMRQAAVL